MIRFDPAPSGRGGAPSYETRFRKNECKCRNFIIENKGVKRNSNKTYYPNQTISDGALRYNLLPTPFLCNFRFQTALQFAMKILSVQQIRKLDAFTIANEPIASIDLMERASMAFVNCFEQMFGTSNPVKVFCGTGNNGGDGLAISRLLSQKGYSVATFICSHSANATPEFETNLDRLATHLSPQFVRTATDFPELSPRYITIDALLGSGINRSTEGLFAQLIQHINSSGSTVVSVDIASGLFADQPNSPDDIIIRPQHTISFQLPKLAFMIPRNEPFVGNWQIADIGLSNEFISKAATDFQYSDIKEITGRTKPVSRFSHKGTFGHALIMAGSYGKIGAAILASRACLRTGTGLLTIRIPKCGYEIMQSSVPEAMTDTDRDGSCLSELPRNLDYNAIGTGPGIGTNPETVEVVRNLLRLYHGPLVLDADALNIVSQHPELKELFRSGIVITPHLKEFERLTEVTGDHYQRLQIARDFARKYQVVICLKGANTAVITPEGQIHFNSTGNPGMATGGSGDVLTGIITALLARGYNSEDAAILGVYIHGQAGDRAASARSQTGMIASDIVEWLR